MQRNRYLKCLFCGVSGYESDIKHKDDCQTLYLQEIAVQQREQHRDERSEFIKVGKAIESDL